MRRVSTLLLLALAGPAVGGDQAETPRVFFRKPDPVTKKRITEDLISGKGLGSGTRSARSAARAELVEIGAWTVPFLADAVFGRSLEKNVRVRMNAVATLARILDPFCLKAVRGAAERDATPDVRITACLALGLFRQPDDRALLHRLMSEKDEKKRQQPAAALALAKLRDVDAASILRANANSLPRDEALAAAILLAAAVASPKTDCARHLGHADDLVRSAAAAGLMIRPLAAADAGPLLEALKDPREDRHVRALQVHALGAIRDRTDEIRERLLDCIVRGREKDEAKIAAAIALAYEWNVQSNFEKLHRAYGARRGRNDPLVAALLFAMARSGHPDAEGDLLKVAKTASPFLRFYAVGSLLHVIANSDQAGPREIALLEELQAANRDVSDDALDRLMQLVSSAFLKDPEERHRRLRTGLAGLRDPRGLHLWDWSREDRAWATVNRLIPVVFALDDIADKGDPLGRPVDEGSQKVPEKSTGGGAPKTPTPEEQDLLDFLDEQPYFGPEDLGDG